ncbi:hypothetical protein BRADI_1g54055v3 [Brachypodium distachyon]|uniref:Uncharacterized protein n=1 Tax=Brachypodium distachyon TaxID=15368 RepID=A0A0Q3S5D1_BRADI|nr:hypothetical protein BRADI_1g54055v3 [Brachypodium distachyon]
MKDVWDLSQIWSNTVSPASTSPSSIDAISHRGRPNPEKRADSGRLLYTWWGVWKERNRRVFRNVALPPLEVAHLVWEDIRVPPWNFLYSASLSNRMTGINRLFVKKRKMLSHFISLEKIRCRV